MATIADNLNGELMRNILIEGLDALKIDSIPDAVIDNLFLYWQMVLDKNKVMNIISAKQDDKTKVVVHLLDSLTPLLFDLKSDLTVFDLGSGGGLPAVPLKIVKPGWDITLIESTAKKADFLTEVGLKLALNGYHISNTYMDKANKENDFYDLGMARGVSALDKLLDLTANRFKKGGLFLAMKGPQADEELKYAAHVMKKKRITLADRKDITLPFYDFSRTLLLFEKKAD